MMGESSTVSIEQAAAEPAAVAGSVLTTILARNERLGKTSRLLGRMCFIGQVPSQQQAELVAWHEAAVADLTTEAAPENVTGLLLLYPAHFVHVIEVRSQARAPSWRAPAGRTAAAHQPRGRVRPPLRLAHRPSSRS